MKRVFIGVPLSKELQGQVLSLGLVRDIREQALIRWTTPKNLHVTLVPPWQTDKWEEVRAKLEEIKFEPFEIRFDQVVLGPNAREPRMIWAAGEATEQLKDLKLKIERLLGKSSGGRSLRLHATLARFKEVDKSVSNNIVLPQNINWRQVVDRFVLYESQLLPHGANYHALAEFPSVLS